MDQEKAHFDPFGDSLISTQHGCTVCAEYITGMEMALGTPNGTPRQVRCMVCTECTIGSKIIMDAPYVLLGDVGQVEARFGPFGDSVSLGARWVHDLRQLYHGHGNHFGHTRWYY
jgi:hypothetical protein